MAWEKREVYVLTVMISDVDEYDNPTGSCWDFEEYFADTLEEAEEMREKFLNGEDEFYGDLIMDCDISDEKEEREFWVWTRERSR